jgi:hypothetical protein
LLLAYVRVPKLPPGYLACVGVRGRADAAVRAGSNPSGAALAALALLMASCILGPKPTLPSNIAAGDFCASRNNLQSSPRSRSSPEHEGLASNAAAERGYPVRSLDVAGAIGALGLVERLAEARIQEASENEISDLRGAIFDAITIATLDLASTVAHIECEQGRADEIAANLRDAEAEQTRRLTAFSLVLSAAGAVASGVLDLAENNMTASAIVGIGGGVSGGVLGFATLAVHRTAYFRHARNILAEVWYGDAHPDLPDSVWAYLTQPSFGAGHSSAIREDLVVKWKASGRFGKDSAHPSAERIALYLGAGGAYDADGLEDRANMLIDLRDVIDLMNHDLQELATDISYR